MCFFIVSQIRLIKSEWPYLFQLRWQGDHFLKLTGANVELAMDDFVEAQLDTLMCYLQSGTSEFAFKNIAEMMKFNNSGRNSDLKIIIAIKMLANYFSEDCSKFLLCAEVHAHFIVHNHISSFIYYRMWILFFLCRGQPQLMK